MNGKILALARSLAILEGELSDSGYPYLLARCGDVNIKNADHNLLMGAMCTNERERKQLCIICWSKLIPPPPEFSYKHQQF